MRSVGLGIEGAPPVSLVLDAVGVYYDARGPSALERALETGPTPSAETLARAAAGIRLLADQRISKYNDAPDRKPLGLPERYVLVLDQTQGDASIAGAGAGAATFAEMLRAAVAEAEGAPVVVKLHPDALTGRKSGFFTPADAGGGVIVTAARVNPWRLLDGARKVFTVSSQMGFEALMAGRQTHCFGASFYSGWGATQDRAPQPSRRTRRRSVEEIFAAAYLDYPVYYDPDADRLCAFERAVEHLRRERDRAPAG